MSDSPSDSRPGPGRFALVVASSEYEEQTLRRLSAPPRDAQSLARVLEDPEIGGFEVTTLTNAPSFTVLERLEAFFDNRRREDLLLLYVSGHGVLNSDGNLFFATVNTRSDRLRSTSVSAGFVHEVMLNSRARQQVLVLDCCHSGAFARGMVAKRGSGVHTRERFEGRGRIVLTASDALQFAFEGDATGEEAGSLFTRTLVEGLRTGEADLDRDGFVSLQELYDYASDRLLDERAPQRPSMWCFDLQGSVHIARNPRALHAAPDGAEEPAAVEEAGARGAVAPAEPQAEAEGAPAGPEAEAEGAPAEAVVVEVESQAEKAGPEAEPDAAVTEPAASDFGPAYVGTLLPDGATSETTDETEVAIETLLPAGGDERAAPPERRDRDATPVPPKPSRRRAQVIAAASLLGVLGVVLIVFPREGVTAECDDLQIAYVHDDDVWVTHPDGAERQNVTDHPARDRQAAWSPDRSELAFVSDRGQRDAVYVLDMDTLEARPATSDVGQGGDFDPAWHPDGDRLVFSRLGPDGHDLYVVDVPAPGEAPNLPRPFASTSGSDQRPAWSPGPERSVAFHSIEGDRIDVYVVDEDGSNPRRLTDHPARDFHPSWSHDGSVIAFASERGDGTRRIYRMDPDGSGVELLRSDVDVRGWDPNWCAAGDRVAFQSDREGGRNQVFWVDAAGGGGVEQVTTLGGADPSW